MFPPFGKAGRLANRRFCVPDAMPFSTGLSAMIRCAAALELGPDTLLETIAIGTPPNSFAANYYEWEGAGAFLLYTISIVGTEVLLSVSLLDSISEPQVLLRIPDVEAS